MKEERKLLGWAMFIIILAFLATTTVILMEKHDNKQKTPIEQIKEAIEDVTEDIVDNVEDVIEEINESL